MLHAAPLHGSLNQFCGSVCLSTIGSDLLFNEAISSEWDALLVYPTTFQPSFDSFG